MNSSWESEIPGKEQRWSEKYNYSFLCLTTVSHLKLESYGPTWHHYGHKTEVPYKDATLRLVHNVVHSGFTGLKPRWPLAGKL